MLIQENQKTNRYDPLARNFQQKYQKQNMDLNMTFVESVKAFDTVMRD